MFGYIQFSFKKSPFVARVGIIFTFRLLKRLLGISITAVAWIVVELLRHYLNSNETLSPHGTNTHMYVFMYVIMVRVRHT